MSRGVPPDGTPFLLLAQKKWGKENGAPVASPVKLMEKPEFGSQARRTDFEKRSI
jgi:hypothetical protein